MLSALATLTASTKRPPAVAGGKRSVPIAHLSGIACLPLVPVEPQRANEYRQRPMSGTPVFLLETYAVGEHDVAAGDTLIIGAKEYRVIAAATWPEFSGVEAHTHIIVEEVKP